MRIIGFGQVVRLDRSPPMGHEIKVLTNDGREVSVPTDERTVQTLMALWASSPLPTDLPPQDKHGGSREYPESYVATTAPEGVTFGGDYEEAPVEEEPIKVAPVVEKDEMGYPVVRNSPQPIFIRDEDDGQQI